MTDDAGAAGAIRLALAAVAGHSKDGSVVEAACRVLALLATRTHSTALFEAAGEMK